MFPALLLALAPLATPDPTAPWELIEACPRLVVRGSERSRATAVVIGQKDGFAYLLTAHHVVADDPPAEVQFFTRRSYPNPARTLRGCELVLPFRQADFALLKVPTGDTPVPVLPLAAPPPRPRKVPFAAIAVGCSGGEPPTGTKETVAARRFGRREGGEQAFFWETEAAPVAGRSGGPLVVDGRVVGLCAAAKDGRGYYAHLDELLAGLKGVGYGWLWE
ncbi:MAG: serine protease [Fimbriiglobus sp.]|nr:serine protease [Fimbriiglobus sp.]